MKWEITNACVVTPSEVMPSAKINIHNGFIESVANDNFLVNDDILQVNIDGMVVFPGLINSHDHLLGTYYPRIGDRKPYLNWLMWDNDLKASPYYHERQQIEAADLYLLGGYRNLLSGITLVQDHIPHSLQDTFKHSLPIKIADQYSLAHSITSFALPWGNGIEIENQLSIKYNIPFITHCSEGFDEETKNSVNTLHHMGALHKNTVLVHGIAFNDKDIELLAKYNVNVVWCPVSNLYMFQQTTAIKKLLNAGINVALGTDSPMSGSINLFEEISVAKSYYEKTYNETLSDKTILNMLTINSAKALQLNDIGQIKKGFKADLICVRGSSKDPYSLISQMSFEDIMLIIVDGTPVYADNSFKDLFDTMKIKYQTINVLNSKKIIIGDPIGLLNKIQSSLGFEKELPFFPISNII